MSKYAVARNVTDAPVDIDDEGRTIGGGEWGVVRHQTQLVRDHIDGARLVVHTSLDDSPHLSPEARAVVKEVADLNAAEAADEAPTADEPKGRARR